MDNREIKRQIRALRKIKKDAPKKTQARRDINKQIRDLKGQLQGSGCNIIEDKEKEVLIKKIQKVYVHYCDLASHSVEELQKHLDLITKEREG